MKPKPKLSLCYVAKKCKITRKKEVRKRYTKHKAYCKLLDFVVSLRQYKAIINQYKGIIIAKNNEIAIIKLDLEKSNYKYTNIKQMVSTLIIFTEKAQSLNRDFAKKQKIVEVGYKDCVKMLERY
jgi:hypothetical protein